MIIIILILLIILLIFFRKYINKFHLIYLTVILLCCIYYEKIKIYKKENLTYKCTKEAPCYIYDITDILEDKNNLIELELIKSNLKERINTTQDNPNTNFIAVDILLGGKFSNKMKKYSYIINRSNYGSRSFRKKYEELSISQPIRVRVQSEQLSQSNLIKLYNLCDNKKNSLAEIGLETGFSTTFEENDRNETLNLDKSDQVHMVDIEYKYIKERLKSGGTPLMIGDLNENGNIIFCKNDPSKNFYHNLAFGDTNIYYSINSDGTINWFNINGPINNVGLTDNITTNLVSNNEKYSLINIDNKQEYYRMNVKYKSNIKYIIWKHKYKLTTVDKNHWNRINGNQHTHAHNISNTHKSNWDSNGIESYPSDYFSANNYKYLGSWYGGYDGSHEHNLHRTAAKQFFSHPDYNRPNSKLFYWNYNNNFIHHGNVRSCNNHANDHRSAKQQFIKCADRRSQFPNQITKNKWTNIISNLKPADKIELWNNTTKTVLPNANESLFNDDNITSKNIIANLNGSMDSNNVIHLMFLYHNALLRDYFGNNTVFWHYFKTPIQGWKYYRGHSNTSRGRWRWAHIAQKIKNSSQYRNTTPIHLIDYVENFTTHENVTDYGIQDQIYKKVDEVYKDSKINQIKNMIKNVNDNINNKLKEYNIGTISTTKRDKIRNYIKKGVSADQFNKDINHPDIFDVATNKTIMGLTVDEINNKLRRILLNCERRSIETIYVNKYNSTNANQIRTYVILKNLN